MRHEFIGKVKLNYDFYSGSDMYSEGEIEDEMLRIVQENSDSSQIIANDDRWPILYHFSPIRQNVLNWYPFNENSEILEIGAGCGAITGALCESGANVTCIELSKRRSLINAYRHKDCENLEIIVGNFLDVNLTKKFDYITVIGVLEYSPLYMNKSENPFVCFLEKLKGYLKKNGTMMIAIENKFGLKYWAGAREDHTGKVFDGIEGYPNSQDVRTFSHDELDNLLKSVGATTKFYYPYPDYKLPLNMYSDEYLPKKGELSDNKNNFDHDRIYLFDEQKVYDEIIKENMFPFFSNSFLLIANFA